MRLESLPGRSLRTVSNSGGVIKFGAVRGPAGADGSNVLPTDVAIAAAIDNPASDTAASLTAAYEVQVPVTRYAPAIDGVTDDTAAIQAADDAAAAIAVSGLRKGAVEVYFPAGNYRLASTVNKSPRTVWTGPGIRYINSVTPAKNSQGARLIIDHDGTGIAITGPGSPDGVNQHGAMRGLTLYGDTATYPNARSVVASADVREQYFEGILTIGFDFGFHLTDCLAFRFYECYNANTLDTGIYVEGGGEFWFWNTQWTGGVYGAHFKDTGPMNGTGNRWQVSGTANLFIEGCGSFNFQGGFNDSASVVGAGDRYGVIIKDSINIVIGSCYYYSNGTSHAKVIASATGTTAGVALTGLWHPGAGGSTTSAVEMAVETGGTINDISIGGQFRGVTPFITTGAVSHTPTVYPSTGSPMRTDQDIYTTTDITRDIGSSANRWRNIVANNFRVFANAGDTQPRTVVASAAIQFGPGGSTAIDTQIQRNGANLLAMAAGDTFAVDGTYNGGKLRLGTWRQWVTAAGTIFTKNTSDPGSDTDGYPIGGGPKDATTANLVALAATVNTVGKYAGKCVLNTTTSKPVWALGAAAADLWVDATGATAHTPV